MFTLDLLFSEAASDALEVSSLIFFVSKNDNGIIIKMVARASIPYTSLQPSDYKALLKRGGQIAPEK